MNAEEVIDLSYLEQASGGNAEMRAMLLAVLQEEYPKHVANLADAFLSEDVTAVFRASHHLKSTLHYLGNPRLIQLNALIEGPARQGAPLEEYLGIWQELAGLLDLVGRRLAELS